MKLTSYASRLRERTAGRGKPRETILLLHVLVSVQSDCYDLTLNQPEPIARLGPEQELSI